MRAVVFTEETIPPAVVGAVFQRFGADLEIKPPGSELIIKNTVITSALLGGDFYTSTVVDDELVFVAEAEEYRNNQGTVVVIDEEKINMVHVDGDALEDGDGIVRYL